MKIQLLTLTFCLLTLTAIAQEVQCEVAKGLITNIDNSGIASVKVFVPSSGEFTYSNSAGYFEVNASIGSKIVFSYAGIDTLSLWWPTVSCDTFTFMLHDKILLLPEILIVESYKSYLERSVPDTMRSEGAFNFYTDRLAGNQDFYLRKNNYQDITETMSTVGPKASFTGPFTLFYRAFSKEYKELRKIEKQKERDALYDNIKKILATPEIQQRFLIEYALLESEFYAYLEYYLVKFGEVVSHQRQEYKIIDDFFYYYETYKEELIRK